MFNVELVWNREFDFVPYGPDYTKLDEAIIFAEEMEKSGGGERVKKTRVINECGKVVWTNGKKL